MTKVKIKRRYQLEDALEEMGTIVVLGSRTFKFMPYWFEFNDQEIIAHYIDNIPSELRNYISKKAELVTKKIKNDKSKKRK